MTDFFDPKTLEIFGQLALAAFLGLLVGIERRMAYKFAGMRTHALVAMGSALFSIVSSVLSGPTIDPTRIAAQVVTGIGFLGAGIIVFQDSKVRGLTTAAGIWSIAAIGMAVGFKLYAVAIFATVVQILIFMILWPIEERFFKRPRGEEKSDSD
ncbi:MAG: MgtC/SapB family protein [bacterium]|nr:MgtC/SapB family protein [bacterium]